MRRFVFSTIVALGLVMVGPSGAFANPTPVVSVKATPGKKVCKVTDPKLDELSGLVATKTGFVAIDDGTTDPAKKKIFFLNTKCKVTNTQAYSGRGPLDPEDLILSKDGATLWIADTGDNGIRLDPPTHRENNVVLWSMPVGGDDEPKLHRIAYPDGDYHDAEALLLNGNGTPLIITKEIGRAAGIYAPTAALKTDNKVAVPMRKVGEITVPGTETPANLVARIGNKTITGGAIAPGGAKVALRTYTDALEWDVTGGDVLAALQQRPRITGLPNETFGESITYSADGKSFYTVSDMDGNHTEANNILQYVPSTTVGVEKKGAETGDGAKKAWYADLSINDITLMIGAVGLIGLLLVGAGVLGIVRSRKRGPVTAAAAGADGFGDGRNDDPETELIGVGGVPQRPGVYGAGGGGRPPGPAAAGVRPPGGGSAAMYGGAAAGGAKRPNGVYGGAPGAAPASGSAQYARPPAGAPQPARNGQQPPARGGQQPARGGQQPPARGDQPPARGAQPPARGGQPPARGGQQPPARGDQPPARGAQPPARGAQPPARGGQPPARGGQQPPARNGVYGAPPVGPKQQPPRPPQGQRPPPGQVPRPPQGQPPRPPQGQAPPRPPQAQGQRPPGPAQRPQGVYGQGDGRPKRGGDEYGDQDGRPDGRFDNPGYGRR
jgi:hypothetical protein